MKAEFSTINLGETKIDFLAVGCVRGCVFVQDFYLRIVSIENIDLAIDCCARRDATGHAAHAIKLLIKGWL